MNDQYPIEPLAAEIKRALRLKSVCEDGAYEGPLSRFFRVLTATPAYRAVAERPHSLAAFRCELESRAVELHRDHGIVLRLLEPGDAEELCISQVKA